MKFMPRVPGQRPLDPTNQYDYQPIAVVEAKMSFSETGDDDDDNDSEDVEITEVNAVELGEIVNTQWGFGRVTKINRDTIRVAVPGFKEAMLVSKAAAYLIGNEKAKLEIRSMFKKKQIEPLFPAGVDPKFALGKGSAYKFEDTKNITVPKFNPSQKLNVEDDDGDTDTTVRFGRDKVKVKDKDQTVDMELILVDKQVSLGGYQEDNDTEILVSKYGFRELDPFYAVQIDNYRAFDKFLERLKARYTVREEFIEALMLYRDAMRKNRLSSFDPTEYEDAKRFITKTNHVKVAKNVVRPYGVVWNGTMFVCFNRETQPAAATLKQRLTGIPGLSVFREKARVVRLFRSASEAISVLKMIMEKVNVTNGDELLDELRAAKRQNY